MNLDYKGYLFDLDGVLWFGKNPVPRACETLETLRSRGKHVFFVSNTSSRSRNDCLEKFEKMGMPIRSEELFLATEETAKHLALLKPGARTCVLGAAGLFSELQKAGLQTHPPLEDRPESYDFVVVGKDRTITFDKLTFALRAIKAGAKLVAVNLDPTVPGSDGLQPGAGAIAAAISSMIGRPVDICIGKPGTLLLELALQQSSLAVNDCVMIGDTLEADIAAGRSLGMQTILVLTGNTARDAISPTLPWNYQPDWIMESIADLI